MRIRMVSLCAAALSLWFSLQLSAQPPLQIRPPRDADFFAIATIDAAKQELVLRGPMDLTQVARVTNHTPYLDLNGNELSFKDLRVGDTVYVIMSRDIDGVPRILSLHRGPMTAEEFHRRLGI
ncbi:MAG: hypothetical protein LAP13_27440 [Acidobacteriia bacterium]|nr:hypothetical protein [Terriglobia bacterium]